MIRSRYTIEISGKNTKRFLKELIKKGLTLYHIEDRGKTLIISCPKETKDHLLNLKTTYQIKIKHLTGIERYLVMLKKYKFFLIMILFSFLLLKILTMLILEVEVIHSNQELKKFLIEELNTHNISKYNFKISYEEKEKIINTILTEHKDKIEWLEITEVGNKYIVRVEPRVFKEEQTVLSSRNIIAKKDGMITYIEASSGTVVKEINDYVKEGEVIISGEIKNNEELKKAVSASGKVLAETWYQVEIEMPLYYYEEKTTTNTQNIVRINLFNNIFNIFSTPYDFSKEEQILSLGNSLFPFNIEVIKQQEIIKIEENYTKEKAVLRAEELAKTKLLQGLPVNSEIIYQKTLKTYEKNSKIIVEVFFKTVEDITSYQEIIEEQIEQ